MRNVLGLALTTRQDVHSIRANLRLYNTSCQQDRSFSVVEVTQIEGYKWWAMSDLNP